MILFFGDVHGKFGHVERAVAELRPAAIILLGDIEAQHPLHEELAKVMDKTDVWYIHGNHDTDSSALFAYLTDSELAHRNLHGKVVEIDGVRVAGLGGVFREDIWWPNPIDNNPHYESYEDYMQRSEAGHILSRMDKAVRLSSDAQNQLVKAKGKQLKHRSTIFISEYYELVAQEADILVTHEAPSCHPYGFMAIDELARSMRVQKSFHGHQHDNLDYQAKWSSMGFMAFGVGLRGIKDMNGAVIKPGEKDEQRACRQDRAE